MKKIISILLCAIFLFNVSGYFVVYKLMQYSAREEIRTLVIPNIPEEEMEVITIPNSEINSSLSEFKYIEENEFRYKGKLYDIVKRKTDNNNTIFYCINDKKEDRLIEEFNEHLKRNTDQNNSSNNKTNLLVQNIIKEALPEKSDFIVYNTNQNILFFQYISLIKEQFIPILSPPPKA